MLSPLWRVLREMGRAALSRYDLEVARQRMKECVALVEPAWKTMAFDTTECAEAWELHYYKVPLAARSIAGDARALRVRHRLRGVRPVGNRGRDNKDGNRLGQSLPLTM